MQIIFLVFLAVVPPVLFLFYILRHDRLEPEPFSLIFKALLLGGLSVIPAGLAEVFLERLPLFSAGGIVGAGLKSFLMISPIEEAVKLGVVLAFIWRNPNFNEENDGVVYTGAVAIGFALIENIFYVVESGLTIGIMRSVTSIPLHTFTGVIMGYFVGIARFAPDPGTRKRLILRGFVIAYLVHAAYDTVALSESAAALLLVPLVVALFVAGIRFLKRGQSLSARRWDPSPPPSPDIPAAAPEPTQEPIASAAPEPAVRAAPRTGTYKIVISRLLFAGSAIFWALLIVGIVTAGPEEEAPATDLVAGGIILTIVPLAVGLALEISRRRTPRTAE